jgi:DNA-binding response OmpR family regulator
MPQTGSILIVDDEPNLRRSLSIILQRSGYQVTAAADGAEALRFLQAGEFHLAFLDIKMPDMDGITLLTEIRGKFPSMPIFMLTAHATLDTAVQALRYGANDYLLKPIDPEVILKRIEETLAEQRVPQRRREIATQLTELLGELHSMENPAAPAPAAEPSPPADDARFLRRGDFTLDLHLRTLQLEGRTIQLTPSTFNFLVVLIRHAPDPVTYEVLVQEAQGYELSRAEARDLARGHVHELRKAVEPDLKHPRFIVTVRDVGYRLVI